MDGDERWIQRGKNNGWRFWALVHYREFTKLNKAGKLPPRSPCSVVLRRPILSLGENWWGDFGWSCCLCMFRCLSELTDGGCTGVFWFRWGGLGLAFGFPATSFNQNHGMLKNNVKMWRRLGRKFWWNVKSFFFFFDF